MRPDFSLFQNGEPIATPDSFPIDLITCRRLLDLRDVDFVRTRVGRRAATRRRLVQARCFLASHAESGAGAARLVRARALAGGSPLDVQMTDTARLVWLWAAIALLAALHFAGVRDCGAGIQRAYRRLRPYVLPEARLTQ